MKSFSMRWLGHPLTLAVTFGYGPAKNQGGYMVFFTALQADGCQTDLALGACDGRAVSRRGAI